MRGKFRLLVAFGTWILPGKYPGECPTQLFYVVSQCCYPSAAIAGDASLVACYCYDVTASIAIAELLEMVSAIVVKLSHGSTPQWGAGEVCSATLRQLVYS